MRTKSWRLVAVVLAVLIGIALFRDNRAPAASDGEQGGAPADTVASGMREVNVYFLKSGSDACAVYPVPRQVENNASAMRQAVQSLLTGPTSEEEKAGYASALRPGALLNSMVLENAVLNLDIEGALDPGFAKICKAGALYAELDATARQFPPIDSVIASLGGDIQLRSGLRE